jgi:hypothetical protein
LKTGYLEGREEEVDLVLFAVRERHGFEKFDFLRCDRIFCILPSYLGFLFDIISMDHFLSLSFFTISLPAGFFCELTFVVISLRFGDVDWRARERRVDFDVHL